MWRLQNRDDVECRFFQKFAEEGHYGGRDGTRQGIYAVTPSGRFLASVNTNNAGRMMQMMRTALAKWKKLPPSDRLLDRDPAEMVDEVHRRESRFPENGLGLRVYSRDLARTDLPDDWRAKAWNTDTLWFKREEALSVLPRSLRKGVVLEWPEDLVLRLARLNLVDNVRGQTPPYRKKHIREARIVTRVIDVRNKVATVRFEGRTRASTTGTWPDRYADLADPEPYDRGLKTHLYGEAVYDGRKGRFTSFALVAAGSRWGRTRYNFRKDDLDPAPIAFAIILPTEEEKEKPVAPAHLGAYGW